MSSKDRVLQIPAGYDASANPRVASFAAQLDDQLSLLKRNVDALETRHLEWQPHPGMNTVGMLLAHLAVVDVWWISVAPHGMMPGPEADEIFRRHIGMTMDDDGMPLAAGGSHPTTLSGWPLAGYLERLDQARAATHEVLRSWTDADLSTTFTLRDRAISREWVLYHVLEHFASHLGQALLLMHLMRDAGLLPAQKR